MSLVWKLLRQHISIPQFIGFFFANLLGMVIVLLGIQFYRDVLPVFTADDSFMKSDFVILSKKIGTGNTISGRSNAFTASEIDELSSQLYVTKVGQFTRAEYKLDASMGVGGQSILNSELFFESVPDEFIDVPLDEWTFTEGSKEVPVIIPRTYINMYNFGFAQTHSLPKISEGLLGMIDFHIYIHGNGLHDEYKGRVVGFSHRLNSILVPHAFMQWSNNTYAPAEHSAPTRLLVQVSNPADKQFTRMMDNKGYEMEDDRLDAEKTAYFLRLVVSIVLIIGLVISLLSFYILMLSIFLLVQKNTTKLENLLLIGYSPSRVARPYQLLTVGLNVAVLIIAFVVVWLLRRYYMGILESIFPEIAEGAFLPALLTGLVLFILVTLMNVAVIRRKIDSIWRKRK